MDTSAQNLAELFTSPSGLVVLVVGVILGLIFGLIIAALGSRRNKGDAAKAEEVTAEFENYRSEVNAHFARTGELVSKLTDDYRAVYEHLAGSASKLCTTDASGQPVGFPALAQQLDDGDRPAIDSESTAVADANSTAANPTASSTASSTVTGTAPEDSMPGDKPVAASIPNAIDDAKATPATKGTPA